MTEGSGTTTTNQTTTPPCHINQEAPEYNKTPKVRKGRWKPRKRLFEDRVTVDPELEISKKIMTIYLINLLLL